MQLYWEEGTALAKLCCSILCLRNSRRPVHASEVDKVRSHHEVREARELLEPVEGMLNLLILQVIKGTTGGSFNGEVTGSDLHLKR